MFVNHLLRLNVTSNDERSPVKNWIRGQKHSSNLTVWCKVKTRFNLFSCTNTFVHLLVCIHKIWIVRLKLQIKRVLHFNQHSLVIHTGHQLIYHEREIAWSYWHLTILGEIIVMLSENESTDLRYIETKTFNLQTDRENARLKNKNLRSLGQRTKTDFFYFISYFNSKL